MMNQEDLFKKIGTILNELQDQYEYLAQNSKQINELELELFFANASFLTDHVQILQKVNNSKPMVSIPEHTEVNPEEPLPKVSPPVAVAEPVIESVVIPVVEPEILPVSEPFVAPVEEPIAETPKEDIRPEIEKEIFKLDDRPASFEFILSDKPSTDKFEFEETPVTEIFDRPLSVEEQRIIEEKQKMHAYKERDLFEEQDAQDEELLEEEPLEEEAVLNPADEVGPEPFLVVKEIPSMPEINQAPSAPEVWQAPPAPEIRETEPTAKPTLTDILAGNMGLNTNSASEQRKPAISDLKQAITLNQKLLFIKDLFNGYNLAYAEAVDLLNKMTDFKTADTFLQKNYAVKNNWAEKQATTNQFYELLHQRFPED